MTAFIEKQFPLSVSLAASGGPGRRTQIIALSSGAEERNQQWADSRRRYDAGVGIRSLADIHAVIAFFEECRGRLTAFRWKDPFDHASAPPGTVTSDSDQPQTVAMDAATFQLTKTYGGPQTAYERIITKPQAGTVIVRRNGDALVEDTHFSVNTTTGEVSNLSGLWLATDTITAGFDFDVPVRFDTDTLDIDLKSFRAGIVPSIPIIEVRL